MNKEQKAVFAIRLGQLRNAKKETQEELSEAIGVDRCTIAKYETQKRIPSYEHLVLLADYFNVSLDYLLGRTDIKTPNATVALICEHTGLSEDNIKFLNKLNELKKMHKKYNYEEVEYIDIISKLLEGLNEDRSIVTAIAEVAVLNNSKDHDLLSKISSMICENFSDININDFKILSGYDYKQFYMQEIHSKVNRVIDKIVTDFSPEDTMSFIYNVSKAITISPRLKTSLEEMVDVQIKCFEEFTDEAEKEDSDNAQHNPKNE